MVAVSDHGRTFRVQDHHVLKADPPEELDTSYGATMIGYQCVDCGFWGQAVSEFTKAHCERDADHRGEPEDPIYLTEAMQALMEAFLMVTRNDHRDPALASVDEAAAYLNDYRRGPLQLKDHSDDEAAEGGQDE